jgi:hypothetical protein
VLIAWAAYEEATVPAAELTASIDAEISDRLMLRIRGWELVVRL